MQSINTDRSGASTESTDDEAHFESLKSLNLILSQLIQSNQQGSVQTELQKAGYSNVGNLVDLIQVKQ
jgi:hypothetical protein